MIITRFMYEIYISLRYIHKSSWNILHRLNLDLVFSQTEQFLHSGLKLPGYL